MNEQSETVTEMERVLRARGDVAVVTLQAMRSTLQPMLETNITVQQHLTKILERQPQTGTLLNIIADVTTTNVNILRETVEQINQVLSEINTFMDGTGAQVDDAIDNVIAAIKTVSDFHRDLSDDEIKRQIGLQ